MITYVVGDLFTSPAKVLVNTVNTVGVMGKGIAYEFKRIYPEMFEQYQFYCYNDMFDIGKLWLYKTSHKWILNFPTKKHWRNKSKVEYIAAGLEKFANTYDSKGIVSISFPMLGCGNGELDWEAQVQAVMEEYLRPLPIDTYIHLFKPDSTFVPEHRNISEMTKWLRSEPRYLPFVEFWEDILGLAEGTHQFVTIDGSISFTVTPDLFGQGLTMEYDTGSFHIHRDDFETLWVHMRPSGYFPVRDLAFHEPTFDLIAASFLRHLPYVSPIELCRRPSETKWDIGLLLSVQSSERASDAKVIQSA